MQFQNPQHAHAIIQQQKVKKGYSFETPTNQLDISINNQQINEPGKPWTSIVIKFPPSNKNLLQNEQNPAPLPFIYAPDISKQPGKKGFEQLIFFIISLVKQPSCWQILFPRFQAKSFNFVFIIFLLLYFIATYLYYQFGPYSLQGCALYQLGAKFSPVIIHEEFFIGHFHRLIVSIPLFGGILHATISLLTMLMFGFVVQQYLGSIKYIIMIFVSGFVSNLMSAVVYPYFVSVGSCGFTFAIITAYGSFLIKKQELLGQSRNLIISLYILMVIANLLTLVDTKAIDIAGIFGGVLSGFCLCVFYYEREEMTLCYKIIKYTCLLMDLILIIVLISVLFTLKVDQIDIHKWCE